MSYGSVIFTDLVRGAKTNHDELAGTHCFERVGLGKAPFRILSYGKGHTSCDYCGTAIFYIARIQSADGKEFKVGCDCVFKTGDGGLVRDIKNSADYRRVQREKRADLDQRKSAEIEHTLAQLELHGHALLVEGFRNRLRWCGMAGRARVLKELRQVAASAQP